MQRLAVISAHLPGWIARQPRLSAAAGLLGLVALGGGLLELPRIDRKRVWRVGADDAHPYYYVQPGGRVNGLAVEVLNEAARRLGVRLEWVPTRMSLDSAVASQVVDLWPVVSITPERARRLHLTEPWLLNRFAIVSLESSHIRSSSGLAGKTVAHLGFPQTRWLARRLLAGAQFLETRSREDAVAAVCSGLAVAGFAEGRNIDSILLERPPGCEAARFRVQFVPGATVPMGIAAHSGSAAVADALERQILELAADGTLFRLSEKWSPFSASEAQTLYGLRDAERRGRWFLVMGMVFCAGAAGLVWLNWRVRQEHRAAEMAGRAKTEFLANISHEIRTPMNAIVGMTDLALAAPPGEEQREFLLSARRASRSLLAMMNQLLDFSRIDSGRFELDIAGFRLADCVNDAVASYQGTCAAKGVTLVTALDPALPERVRGDRWRLFEVLSNLIANAAKFTEAGSIVVSVHPAVEAARGTSILFSVADTGIGIAPEHQRAVFEPFRQADGSTSRKYGGAGLGLAICSRIVERMGGRIWLESTAGTGSTFHFTAELEPAADEAAGKPRRLSILLAEDNEVNLRVAQRVLERAGHAVRIARNGSEAVAEFRNGHFDLILMDLQMPSMDGLEATRAIRGIEAGSARPTPVIAMTACACGADRVRCFEAGMDDYVSKPIDAAQLLETVGRAAGAGGNISRNRQTVLATE